MRIFLKILRFFLVLIPLTVLADNGGKDEASFTNTSKQEMFCYGDIDDDFICQISVMPGESCQGDAMGDAIGGRVFKVPNKTSWKCKYNDKDLLDCSSDDVNSSLMTAAASLASGFSSYYTLTWSEWIDAMGPKSVKVCNKEYKPTSDEVWVPFGSEKKCDYSSN